MRVISTTDDLAQACARLASGDHVTVDTEFMREATFWPRLCLAQIAGPHEAHLIDTLAEGLDLAPFFALMADESVTKVFHAARQDIEIIHHLGGLIPHPVFDTQVAAMVCGFGDSVSYDQLVYKITGARIDKSSRFTDWSRRPLSEKQLRYALADVTHLRDVYQALKANLEEQDRSEWVREEMEILTSPDTYRQHPEDAWKRLKMRVRRPRELAVLKEVAAWREREAQSRDVPRNRVIKDDVIYEIATQQPTSEKALARLRAIPKGFERSRAAAGILEAVARALAIPEEELAPLPSRKRSAEGSPAAVELLKVLLRMTSERHGVAAKVIATVDDLEKIAADEKAEVAALRGWRRALFGDRALKLRRGELALSVRGRHVVAIERTVGDAAGQEATSAAE